MSWKDMFRKTLSVKIAVEDRVKHRDSQRLGTVFQTATVSGVPVISVRHDDGTESHLLPAEEYHKVPRGQQLLWARAGRAKQY